MTTWWAYARLAASVLAVAAIVAQLVQTLEIAMLSETEWGSHLPTVIVNFFSFFTILSNVLAAVALVIGGLWGILNRKTTSPEPRWLALILVCASTYAIVTGIVYNTLLRGIELPQGATVPWSNEVLHVIVPLIMLLDLLFAPRRRALGWSAVGAAAVFPLVWVAYTMIRADLVISPATGQPYWYPYPFLNPHTVPGGYLGVSAYIVGIAIAIIAVAAGVVWIGRRRGTTPIGS